MPLKPFWKAQSETYCFPALSTDCSKVCTVSYKMVSQHHDAFECEVHGSVCEQSWALKAELCWDWKNRKQRWLLAFKETIKTHKNAFFTWTRQKIMCNFGERVSKLDLCEGGSFSPTIFKNDIEISVYHISCFISVCPFDALSKARFAENLHIVLSNPYFKKCSFLTYCVFLVGTERVKVALDVANQIVRRFWNHQSGEVWHARPPESCDTIGSARFRPESTSVRLVKWSRRVSSLGVVRRDVIALNM